MINKQPNDIYELMENNYHFNYPFINKSIKDSLNALLNDLIPTIYNKKEKKQIKLKEKELYEETRWTKSSVIIRISCHMVLCELTAKIENEELIISTELFPECDICHSKDVVFEEIQPIQIVLVNNHIREFDCQCRCNQCKRIQLF